MKEVDENGYAYLGILELDEIKEQEMKIKVFLGSTKLKTVWIKITTFFIRRVSILL